jgi:hypothetical protein
MFSMEEYWTYGLLLAYKIKCSEENSQRVKMEVLALCLSRFYLLSCGPFTAILVSLESCDTRLSFDTKLAGNGHENKM